MTVDELRFDRQAALVTGGGRGMGRAHSLLLASRGARVVVSDADADMPVALGTKFVQSPMKYFLRIDGAVGLHAGWVPGYPASHGCIRLPPGKAALFFNIVEVGTPVRVFGTAPKSPAAPVVAKAATPIPTPTPRRWFSLFQRGRKQAGRAMD